MSMQTIITKVETIIIEPGWVKMKMATSYRAPIVKTQAAEKEGEGEGGRGTAKR
jgi:hypothetical protein